MAKRVLIVDDAISMRTQLRDIFTEGGFEVVGEASHGLDAVSLYDALRPDLITMDIVMPYKNGIEATREILEIDRNAVVLICSALGQESLVLEAIEAGASDFVLKPFHSGQVLEAVGKILGIAA